MAIFYPCTHLNVFSRHWMSLRNYHLFNSGECIGGNEKPCSYIQFIKKLCNKSHENPYQYCKSCENLYSLLPPQVSGSLGRYSYISNSQRQVGVELHWSIEQSHLSVSERLSSLIDYHRTGFTIVSEKGPMGGGHYFVLRQGWTDICNMAAFYHEKAPMFTLSQPTTGYCTPTHPPSTSLIQFSVCISQACAAST